MGFLVYVIRRVDEEHIAQDDLGPFDDKTRAQEVADEERRKDPSACAVVHDEGDHECHDSFLRAFRVTCSRGTKDGYVGCIPLDDVDDQSIDFAGVLSDVDNDY